MGAFPDPNATQARIPVVKFSDYKLANGLRVILSPDHSAPVIAVSVTYNVGSRNEHLGRTGFAHLFEHMMFQGSKNVGKGEHMMLIQNNGGTMNGTTNQDRTNYFEALPANQLDLALFLEADRMSSLDISQTNLDNQRAVVQEEKRQSYDNQPYGQMGATVDELAFQSFAYQHSTIGSMSDLNAANLDDLKSFFKTYYAPNNAVIAVVGDFKENDARQKVEHYFGSIPSQPTPPPVDTTEGLNVGEKRKTIVDPLARLTRYEAAYKTVSGNDPDSYALQILGTILSEGRVSPVYQNIVEKRLALNASASCFPGRGPALFSCSATIPQSGSVQSVETEFESLIKTVQDKGVSDSDLQRARIGARAAVLLGGGRRGGGGTLLTDLGKANAFSQNAVFFNDPGRINTNLDKLLAVSAADVQRVAKKYLVKENRVVVIDEPAPSSEDGGF
jgi:predicted Zn-dependent peptidase